MTGPASKARDQSRNLLDASFIRLAKLTTRSVYSERVNECSQISGDRECAARGSAKEGREAVKRAKEENQAKWADKIMHDRVVKAEERQRQADVAEEVRVKVRNLGAKPRCSCTCACRCSRVPDRKVSEVSRFQLNQHAPIWCKIAVPCSLPVPSRLSAKYI